MSLDLVALEISRAWGRDPWWVYTLTRSQFEELLGWWRAVNCEAPPTKRKLSKTATADQRARSFWLGG